MNKMFIWLLLISTCIWCQVCSFKFSNGLRKISDSDIQNIFEQYINPLSNQEYCQRYVPLPFDKNNLSWRWEHNALCRVISLLEFGRFVQDHNIICKKGLAINGRDPEWCFLEVEPSLITDYEKNPLKFDLYTLDLDEKDFDFVMCNATLEHVYDPLLCLENIYKHMVHGGILYLCVPANGIFHSMPFYFYTGFTPMGIGAVIMAAGFKILRIGQWGNLEYLKKMFETNSWPDYVYMQTVMKDPGYNDLNVPVTVWAFAIKQ